MAMSWCKVSTDLDMHPKVRRAGRNGREVFLFALRRNAGPGMPVPGLLPASNFEAWYLADLLMMSEADAADGVDRAVKAGLIERAGKAFRIVGWDDEWGRIPKSSAERQAEFRARQRGETPPLEKKTYAIEQVGTGYMKIGRAANIEQRLYDLQVASPVPLRLIAFSLNDIEGELHAKLAQHKANGEWFHLNDEAHSIVASHMTVTAVTPGSLLVTDSNVDSVTGNDPSNGLKREEKRREEIREEEIRSEKKKKDVPAPPDVCLALADSLLAEVGRRQPGNATLEKPKTRLDWARTFDLIQRVDHVSEPRIREAIHWLFHVQQRGQYETIVRSASALRTKLPDIAERMSKPVRAQQAFPTGRVEPKGAEAFTEGEVAL